MRRLVVLAAVVLVAVPAQAAAPSPAQKLQRELDGLVATGIPGAILLVRDRDRTVRLTSGVARISPSEPMRAGDRFRVGSITKSFVSAVVLQLVGEGKLALSDSLEHWLPGAIPNGAAITIRQLLNHTSGIYNYTEDPALVNAFLTGNFDRDWTPQQLVALAAAHRPLFQPGTAWSYSNTNFILLGLIVEKAAGTSLAEGFRARVFEPLGLDGTSLPSASAIDGQHAHGYEVFAGRRRDVTLFHPSWSWAAGAIVSTADDLADFYRAVLHGELVTRHLVWRMESTVSVGTGDGYGLGLASTSLPCSIVWGHNGAVPGFLTLALSSGNGVRQVVLSLNSTNLSTQAVTELQALVNHAYCGKAARG
jgi:D-alanyl-D-alanine carboxypeptidase